MGFSKRIENHQVVFYILLLLTVVSIFFTNPFLKYPFDIYTHLEWIEEQYGRDTFPLTSRYTWHYIWSNIFYFFSIDNTNIFFRAYIIHYTQVLISFFSLFFLSHVIIKNIFIKIEYIYINYLAYVSVLIWFTILGSSSMGTRQIWTLWYSVNYQIALPLVLLMLGLVLSLVFATLEKSKKVIYIIMIFFFSFLVIKIHTLEFLYFLLYLIILIVLFADKIILWGRHYLYYVLPSVLIIIYLSIKFFDYIIHIPYRTPPLLEYLSWEKLPELLQMIAEIGHTVVDRYSKAITNVNELMYVSFFLLFSILFIEVFRRNKKRIPLINIRLIIFIIFASSFTFIPLNEFSAGIASMLTYNGVVYRFAFGSLSFIAIPIAIFYMLSLLKIRSLSIILLLSLAIVSGTFFYSKYFTNWKNYYTNIISIRNSFYVEKVGFNLSKKDILSIGEKLKIYEKEYKASYYYAREDIAYIIKEVYQREVYLPIVRKGNSLELSFYIKAYKKDRKHKNKILFDVPKGFNDYAAYK